jgi:5-aminopentanamidase
VTKRSAAVPHGDADRQHGFGADVIATVVEMKVHPGDVEANLASIQRLLGGACAEGAELVCFPELCLSGYMLERDRYSMDLLEACERALATITAAVEGTHAKVAVGGPRLHQGRLRNSVFLINDGRADPVIYDKTHLDWREQEVFEPGSTLVVVDGLGIACCYDLAFPELSRAMALSDAQLLVFPMAWETRREFVLRQLPAARAIENIAYVLCANQARATPEFAFAGGSRIIDPLGKTVCAVEDGSEWALARLEVGSVHQLRMSDEVTYPFLQDRRSDLY